MLNITCHIRITVYANNQECKKIMHMASKDFGVIGPKIIMPLRLLNGRTYEFKFRENATVKTLINAVKREMEEFWPGYESWDYLRWAILYGENEERYFLDDHNQQLSYLMRKYFGYPENNIINIQLLISNDSGEVDNEEGLQYYIYSHEKGSHHLPHVHVNTTDHNHTAVITIHDGKIIEGSLPGKKRKIARKRILGKQEYFYDCWNKISDGIRVDINKHFKLIGY